jgi:flavin reductase (DIM6/NTAB) family NADH-FMN oxidoreductase RutF
MTHVRFDFQTLAPRDCYKLLIGTVVPRPIAWVTTVDKKGQANAAPYSFFNCLSSDPPILALGIENRDEQTFKDTAWNIRCTEAFTVNIVDRLNLDAMNVTATAFNREIDELEQAGLTLVEGSTVVSPRILEAPVSFECIRHVGIEIGTSREIVLGRVLAAYIRRDIVDPGNHHVDHVGLDAIGRMGGHGYTFTQDYFDLPTLSVEQFESGEYLRFADLPEHAPDQ